GESTRMGRLKALLPWRGTTLFQSQLAAMAGLSPLIVVLGHRSDELTHLIPIPSQWERLGEGPHVVENAHYRQGKSTSIVAGISALPAEADAAIVVAVDQPTEAAILRALAEAYEAGRPKILLP